MKTLMKIVVSCVLIVLVFLALNLVWTEIMVPMRARNVAQSSQQVIQLKWVGETEVGSREVTLKSPPSRKGFGFYVKNAEGTRVLFRLHGMAHYVLKNGTTVKEVIFKDGAPEQDLVSENWEGRVDWIGAQNLKEGVVIVVSDEVTNGPVRH